MYAFSRMSSPVISDLDSLYIDTTKLDFYDETKSKYIEKIKDYDTNSNGNALEVGWITKTPKSWMSRQIYERYVSMRKPQFTDRYNYFISTTCTKDKPDCKENTDEALIQQALEVNAAEKRQIKEEEEAHKKYRAIPKNPGNGNYGNQGPGEIHIMGGRRTRRQKQKKARKTKSKTKSKSRVP